ncbi:hypothetical protein P3393_15565 [Vibrio parahaemolyticus]|nr:hypothetical protein [Vibrio parahaemolyticus]
MKNKKFKGANTAPHIIYNEPTLDGKEKTDAMIVVGIDVEKHFGDDREKCVMVPECAVYDVVDYHKATGKYCFTIGCNSKNLSEMVLEQKATSRLDIKNLETGEEFSFKNSLHLHARLYVLTGEAHYRNVVGSLCQSLINVKSSKKRLQKELSGYGMTGTQIELVMNRKKWKLEKTVRGNLFLPKLNNLSNIISLSEIKTNGEKLALAVKAATGAGKNVHLIDPLIREAMARGDKVSLISPLKNLINKNVETHSGIGEGFTSYEVGQQIIDAVNPKAFAVCINSLSRKIFLEQVLSSKLVIIDEVEACIRNILLGNDEPNSKMRMASKERRLIIEAFVRVVKNAPQLIVADADLSPLTAQFLASIRRDIQICNIEQNYSYITASVATKDVVMLEATQAINLNEKPVAVMFDKISDLKSFLAGLKNDVGKPLNDETALKEGILVLSSETSGRDEQIEFLTNPNEVLASGKYRVILASPTLARGFYITHHFTDKVYVIANGVLDPASMVQFPRRLRTATEFTYGVNTDYNVTVDHTENLTLTGDKDEDEFNGLQAAYKTEHELLVSNIAITLPETLRLLKFNMIEHASLDASDEEIREAQEKSKQNRKMSKKMRREGILAANNITDTKAQELKAKGNTKTQTEIFELTRYETQQKTGVQDIKETEITFCDKFVPSAYKSLVSEMQSTDQYFIWKAFRKAASSDLLKLSEIVVNQSIAVSIIGELQRNVNRVNAILPKHLRLKPKLVPSAALKAVRAILEAAGYRYRRTKRVINGKSVNMYIYTKHEYAEICAGYLN